MPIYPVNRFSPETYSEFEVNPSEEIVGSFGSFLKENAAIYHDELLSSTYLYFDEDIVKGFVTICTGSIRTHDINSSIRDYYKYKQCPVLLIGKLAVHKDFRRSNIGTELFDHALSIILDLIEKISARFVVVHSLKESIPIYFYENLGFIKIKDNDSNITMVFDLHALLNNY